MGKNPNWVKQVYSAMDFISANLDREVSLDEVSRACGLSKFHFHRVFRLVAGETIAQFARRSRIQAAARQLVAGGRDITEVAHEFGFSSSSNFHRALKSEYGVVPSKLKLRNLREFIPKIQEFDHDVKELLLEEPKVVQIPERQVVYARLFGIYRPISSFLKDFIPAYRKLTAWAKKAGVATRPMISATWDFPELTPEDKTRADACLEVAEEPKTLAEGLSYGVLPGGRFVVARVECRNFDNDPCYLALIDWMEEAKLSLADGPAYESYEITLPQFLTGRFTQTITLPV